MTVFLLICHGLAAVALLGAITHQAVAVGFPGQRPAASFVGRMRIVNPGAYAGAIVALYIITAILGAVIYAEYRISVRIVLEQNAFWKVNGAFELKEHFLAVGLGMLPAYWYAWKQVREPRYAGLRWASTMILAFAVWWSFLTGHIVNNVRGLGT